MIHIIIFFAVSFEILSKKIYADDTRFLWKSAQLACCLCVCVAEISVIGEPKKSQELAILELAEFAASAFLFGRWVIQTRILSRLLLQHLPLSIHHTKD